MFKITSPLNWFLLKTEELDESNFPTRLSIDKKIESIKTRIGIFETIKYIADFAMSLYVPVVISGCFSLEPSLLIISGPVFIIAYLAHKVSKSRLDHYEFCHEELKALDNRYFLEGKSC
jgi:hypothetical protein